METAKLYEKSILLMKKNIIDYTKTCQPDTLITDIMNLAKEYHQAKLKEQSAQTNALTDGIILIPFPPKEHSEKLKHGGEIKIWMDGCEYGMKEGLRDWMQEHKTKNLKDELIKFQTWLDKLTPSDKVSVWSEDGSQKGIFNMTNKQLANKYLQQNKEACNG